ncbi:dihydrodipicolinate synthase family protein [Amycolatopsis sp. NPDC051372]|uniref:dihydrodipicolinate synthase family protein n=1 Tax=Amycolatopsis sp. NPDC051372 TaxID=3155669 RepID=UPI0034398A92
MNVKEPDAVIRLWPALLTPITTTGAVDHDDLAALTGDLIARGVDGLVPLGSTGEFTEFGPAERAAILETVVAAAGGHVPVLAGVSGLSTRETCALAAQATDVGVDGVLVFPPLYWKVPEDRLAGHFREVLAATDRPVVLYDFPALTAQPLPPSLLRRLAAEEPQVVGAKLTVRDITAITAALDATRSQRPGFAVVTGFEDLIPAAMWAGADGAISGLANLQPDLLVALVAAVRAGRPEVAALYERVMAIFDVYGLSMPAIPGLKAATAALGRIASPRSRLDGGAGLAEAATLWADAHYDAEAVVA